MSTITAKRSITFTETDKVSIFDKLVKLFSVSPEYAAGYLLMHGSYAQIRRK